MNGARSTYMRRGYLLTALAAAVLLAASPGTALAQVTVTGPAMVAEGDSATYNIAVKGYAAGNAGQGTVTVTLTLTPATGNNATAGDDGDISTNLTGLTYTATVPANTGTAKKAFSSSGSIVLQTTDDADAENENYTLAFAATDVGALQAGAADDAEGNAAITLAAGSPTALTIDDDETQTYTLTLADNQTATEGGDETTRETFVVNMTAVPPHFQGKVDAALHLDAPNDYSWSTEGTERADGFQVTVGSPDGSAAAVNTQAITITTPINDGDRDTDSVTLTAYAGPTGRTSEVVSESFEVADIHTLPAGDAITAMVVDKDGMEVMDASITEGGDSVSVVVTVDRGGVEMKPATTDEALSVAVMAANAAQATDYRVSGSPVTFAMITPAGEQTGAASFTLSAVTDEDVGEETLTLSLVLTGDKDNGPGSSTGTFEIPIVDDTARKIWALDQDEAYPVIQEAIEEGGGDEDLNPGESFMVMMDDLFGVMEGYTASYSAAVEGDAVSVSTSGERVTVTAEMAGDAKVTVTGTARASSSFQAEQTISNVASVTFPVEVSDKDLVVMLHAPDGVMDGNIVEGSSYDIQVTANRMVHEDTMVMFMRDRAASDADGDDYSIENVTIMAGEDMAMATLMVTEDMMDDSGHASGEALVLYAEVNGEETNSLMFTIWDMAVPALPLIGQLVLALFLALGGARLYRRRQG